MPKPRQVLPKRFYLLTRRCTQRQFWLRPDSEINQIWRYCLAEAASRCHIDVVFTTVMSNHVHTVVFDRDEKTPHVIEFIERLHKLVARCVNSLRGRWENLWASESTSIVALTSREDVLAKMAYAATNPVKDNLVERVEHWPGVNAFSDFVNDRSTRVERPRRFFRRNGKMPAAITLRYVVPPELGEAGKVRAELREMVRAEEALLLRARRRIGGRVLGRRAVLRQRCSERPASVEPRRGLDPRVSARSRWVRQGALRDLKEFQRAYQDAREALLRREPAVFPAGTYWLRRFAAVQVAESPPL